jgi:pimeloyl-ACP methyl ester carboxylesterase
MRMARFGVLLALTLVSLVAGLLAARSATASDAPLRRGDFAGLVGVGGGRAIYMECHGRGKPTVILEAGLRSRSDIWSERTPQTRGATVLPGVSRFARVCTYDRPGTTLGTEAFSRSTPVPMPRTAADTVAELHALLRAAKIPGPYVLVGHSTGGLIVRLYASTYPREVVGMVLVDALSEFLQGPLSPAQIAAYDELNNGPLPSLEGYADLEQILFRPSFAQMRRAAAAHPLRPIPLRVISRGLPLEPPEGWPAGLTTAVVEHAWAVAQRRLAQLVPTAHQTIAKRSSHYIMFSQPRLIIREVHRVVRLVRKKARRRSSGGRAS